MLNCWYSGTRTRCCAARVRARAGRHDVLHGADATAAALHAGGSPVQIGRGDVHERIRSVGTPSARTRDPVAVAGFEHSNISLPNQIPGSQTGSQRPQILGDAKPHPAPGGTVKRHVRSCWAVWGHVWGCLLSSRSRVRIGVRRQRRLAGPGPGPGVHRWPAVGSPRGSGGCRPGPGRALMSVLRICSSQAAQRIC
jgi:hypothetical protein